MKERDYSDILYLPTPTSERHPRMSREARAAQFAPFAALSGYGEAIIEEARLTEERALIAEEVRENILRWWQLLLVIEDAEPYITVEYFLPDERKSGGSYRTVSGRLTSVDRQRKSMTVEGRLILLDNVISIDSELYRDMINGETE